jgi:ribosomal protein S18 acetylase RimI-like enzyme
MTPPPGVHIRAATSNDYDLLRVVFDEAEAFHRHGLPHIFRSLTETYPPKTLFTALVEGRDSGVLVAQEGRELIGFVAVRTEHAPDDPVLAPRRFAMVDMLAVRRDRQQHGIGRALMEATHQWAHQQALHEIELNVWEFNQRAIGFYETLGYRTLSRLMERRSP